MRRLFATMLFGLMLAPTAATAASELNQVDMCLGDTYMAPSRAGHVFTYTEPKFSETWPSMAAEQAAAVKVEDPDADSGTPNVVAWSLVPNRSLLDLEARAGMNAKRTPALNPKLYLSALAATQNRIVFHGHSVGIHKIKVWQRHIATGTVTSHIFLVTISQCGTSTLLPASSDLNMCEGAAMVPGDAKDTVMSFQPRVLYPFYGQDSGAVVYSGVRAGYATLVDMEARKLAPVRAQVVRTGMSGCPSTTPADLSVLEGLNRFSLELCKNQSWVMPTEQRVQSITVSNGNLWTETSAAEDGVLVYGMNAGKTTVVVDFVGEHAQSMVLEVNIGSCK